ncbi:hypothetical protein QBC34DRAFT_417455 [Podospora aff. communis PSN243]|uniref:Steroid 5-alpha reductase C-terminal domain-containing protein n=1 Tax=Podospora aff. communis PSN243 TaxID=3040156 RepID=A0AAV9G550_9PEZI|nr:hypothetical protein QBC34DRAFT_417455 [Podospora aff. communis PSN243]
MTFLTTLLKLAFNPSSAFLSNLLPAILASYSVQLLTGIPSVLFASEIFYDLAGGLSFLLTLSSSLFLPALRRKAVISLDDALTTWNWRQLALTGAAAVWSVRLSSYLFLRVLQKGHDSRFDTVKHKPRRFFMFWMIQAVWVLICLTPVIAVDSIHPAAFKAGLGVPDVLPSDVLGFGLFGLGLLIEVVADYQKGKWYSEKVRKVHDELFITRGLWGRCRFPNYFGEITLWAGIAIAAAGVLSRGPIQASLGWYGTSGQLKAVILPGMAPAFVAWLLLRVSGVPLSERKYDKLYRDRKEYQNWRKNTPLLIPKIF